MRLSLLFIAIILTTCTLLVGARLAATEKANRLSSSERIVTATNQLVTLLSDKQRKEAMLPFETSERTSWHFVPMTGQRKGLAIQDMTPEQRLGLHALLQATLSAEGYLKIAAIQQLERLLGELENRPDYRNPGYYYLTIFGTPSLDQAWGWRYEGHHLSMNISMVNGELSVTPTFLGTNPGQVRETVFAGLEVLHEEIGIARHLMISFDDEQRDKALIADTAPREIITGNTREAMLDEITGISYHEMTPQQQSLLMLLLSTYAHNMEADIAEVHLDLIKDAGIHELHFAWAGSLSPEEGHYFRIHGPRTLIEYDNTQNNANHVHTVWRDLTNDFGRDLLRSHYDHSDHNH